MESQCQLQSVLNMSITRELNGYKQSNASNAPLSQRSINDVLVDKTLFQMVSVSNSGTVNTSLGQHVAIQQSADPSDRLELEVRGIGRPRQ